MSEDVRSIIVARAHWGVFHEDEIHYKEIRPMPLTPKLPITTDCSGFATLCYWLAGAHDPNGLNYDGKGFTGTLMDHGQHIAQHQLLPGDLIVYGPHPGVHVTICITPGTDPLVVSHGTEKGPLLIRDSLEHPGAVRTYLRFDTSHR